MQKLRTSIRTSHAAKHAPVHSRSGFSLVELLIVILIIAALMALILPAVNSVRRTARNAAVKAEIDQLATALAQFETRFGKMPPSFLMIPSDGDWSDSGDAARNAALAHSRRRIREIWPRFNFATNGGLGALSTDLVLSGDECLVLALGGIQASNGQTLGFSKNPSTPFSGTGENRDGPFYEFDFGRMSDVDGDGFNSFVDPLPGQTAPYFFLSTGGRKYPDLASNLSAYGDAGDFGVFNGTGKNPSQPYHNQNGVPWKKDSYQIFSAGEDGVYGDPNSSAAGYVGDGVYQEGGSMPKGERDNISNFSTGATMGN